MDYALGTRVVLGNRITANMEHALLLPGPAITLPEPRLKRDLLFPTTSGTAMIALLERLAAATGVGH